VAHEERYARVDWSDLRSVNEWNRQVWRVRVFETLRLYSYANCGGASAVRACASSQRVTACMHTVGTRSLALHRVSVHSFCAYRLQECQRSTLKANPAVLDKTSY